MPRVRMPAPKPNYIAAAIKSYKKANNVRDEDIAKEFGWLRPAVNRKINQPADRWKISELALVCKVTKLPLRTALEEIAKCLE